MTAIAVVSPPLLLISSLAPPSRRREKPLTAAPSPNVISLTGQGVKVLRRGFHEIQVGPELPVHS